MRIIDARFVDILVNVAVTKLPHPFRILKCRGTQRFFFRKKKVYLELTFREEAR